MRVGQGAWTALTRNLLQCAVRDSFGPRRDDKKIYGAAILIVDDFGIAGCILGTIRFIPLAST
jgi:hypothetical protein